MAPRSHATPRYGFSTGLPWMVGATGAIAAITITLPAQAAVLNDWSFDPATRQLQVTLPTGIDPNFLLLAEPARIILNLPNTQVGNVPLARQYSGAVRSIRVSQFDANTTRIVVELAPNTILDPRHAELTAAAVSSGQRWTLRPLIVDGPNGATPAAPPVPAAPPASPAAAPSDSAAAPPLPNLPDPGDAAAVGAVSSPVAPQYTADDGIRTDASALLGPSDGAATGPPPDALPIDPFGQRSQPAVSVPPLTESAAPTDTPSQVASAPQNSAPPAPVVSAPAVTVPPLPARVPSSPPAPSPAPAAPSTAPLAEPSVPASAPPVASSPAIDSDATTGIPLRVEPPPASAPRPPLPAAATPQPAPSPAAPTTGIPRSPESPAPDIAPPFLETTPPTAISPSSAPAAAPPPFLEETPAPPQGPETRTQPPPPSPQAPDGVIPFGTPLPAEGKAPVTVTPGSELPVGTRLRLRYPGTVPLVLDRAEPWYEVLIVDEPVQHPSTGAILVPAGTQVLGRFENNAASGQRFISQVIVQGGDREPVVATSDTLAGTPQGGASLLRNSGIGAAAVMVLSGFSGVGILGGAALGAAATYATTPQLVVIQPGQIIEAEVIVPAPPAP